MTKLIDKDWPTIEAEARTILEAAFKYPKQSVSRRDLLRQAMDLVTQWRDQQEEKNR